MTALERTYRRLLVEKPWLWFFIVLLVSVSAGWQLQNFRLDASADSLILENDKALEFYREIAKRYGGSEFLIVTYEPTLAPLFSRTTLERLATLQEELAGVERVESVYGFLDVPLLYSPPVSFRELASGYRTLRDPQADLGLAQQEFTGINPIYTDLLVNRTATITALLVNFARDETYFRLLEERNALRERERKGVLTDAEERRLDQVLREYSDYSAAMQKSVAAEVAQIRSILDRHRGEANLFLGGPNMIAADAVDFVRSDLNIFGWGVTAFLLLALFVIFRRGRWILVPISVCGLTVFWTSGWLGFADWKVTVISSNYVSMLLILTMSMVVHLTVRFRELQNNFPRASQAELVGDTMAFMARPIIYTTLTTIVAFMSLVFSGIRPVIDFGWMMTAGLLIALLLCLTLYPTLVALLPKDTPPRLKDMTRRVTTQIARFNARHTRLVLITGFALALMALWGTTRLSVENRFIDYFKEHTEIYQGMVTIDRHLGGTTPLDIILDAPPQAAVDASDDPFDDDFSWGRGDEDPFADDFSEALDDTADAGDGLADAWWYTPQNMDLLLRIHNYLESLPETGKVLSLASVYQVATDLNGGPLSYFDLRLLASFVPEQIRDTLVRPYLSEDGNQVRLSVRVIDSDQNLNRNELLRKIETDLVEQFGLQPEQVHLTGAMVLYNNMLQSLFDSQIATIGFVFLSIMIMFVMLFRSLTISFIAMLPNLFSAAFILGLMGWIGLPLDLMTITIAAITIGIAVDDSIHYVHRFREEFPRDRNYVATMLRCHRSIGTAMYYTSVIIIAGFLILVASNFNPTVYFGALISLAMVIATASNLTVLPCMLVWLKPRIPPL